VKPRSKKVVKGTKSSSALAEKGEWGRSEVIKSLIAPCGGAEFGEKGGVSGTRTGRH